METWRIEHPHKPPCGTNTALLPQGRGGRQVLGEALIVLGLAGLEQSWETSLAEGQRTGDEPFGSEMKGMTSHKL